MASIPRTFNPSLFFKRSVLVGLIGSATFATSTVLYNSDAPQPNHYHWNHSGLNKSLDHASIRRGFEVYRQVCSSCHSLKHRAYRQLVGVSHTEEQAKMIAATVEVADIDDKGEPIMRPGKLFDYFPSPYANDAAAAAANGGAIPPDLSVIVGARHHGEDYIYSLLNGYREPPAGLELREGLHYNVYFPGNAIGMAKPLVDEQVEFEDGTPATVSQMAKDVVTFLTWSTHPDFDERKLTGVKGMAALVVVFILAGYRKRFVWSAIKTRKVSYVDSPGQIPPK
jgi:ubiquinol-cytochrome c reductase cytochrome c1 subunit